MDNKDSRPVPDPTTLTTAQLNSEIAHLEKFFSEKFRLAEVSRVELKKDAADALGAAFKAATDAVNKSDATAVEQIRQLKELLTSETKGLSTTVNDLKDRLGRMEAMLQTKVEVKSTNQASVGLIFAMVFGFISMIISLIALFYRMKGA